MRATFETIEGPARGESRTFSAPAAFFVGRGSRCGVQVGPDAACSRRHLLVELSTAGCRIQDLGSKHGATVNGRAVHTAYLADRDQVRIGETVLRVRLLCSDRALSLAGEQVTEGGSQAECRLALEGEKVTEDGSLAEEPRYRKEGLPLVESPMSQLWRATDRWTGEVLALKTLRWGPQVPAEQRVELRRRFLRECALAGELRHPHIVRFRECGEQDGTLFIAMELVEGPDAQRHCRQAGLLGAGDAMTIGLQVLEALEHAHGSGAKGTIHRDLKPANLLLAAPAPNWHVKVADFGLAKSLDDLLHAGITRGGNWGGTLQFIPPEQARELSKADHRADLFSLAASMYWLLTGHYVYSYRTQEELAAVAAAGRVVPIEQRGVSLPPALRGVISRALEPDPSRRYGSAREMALALAQARGGD